MITRRGVSTPFEVHLDVFSGPFDLLLGLIAKHKLDITEVALAQVTDEFIGAHPAAQAADSEWDLGQASRVPAHRRHPARPQGRAPAAVGRPAGRGGPRAHRGPRPAVRPAAAVPRVQGHRRRLRASGWPRPGAITPRQAGLEPRVRRAAARARHGGHPRAARDDRGPGDDAAGRARPSGSSHLHAPAVSVREQAAIIVRPAAARAARCRSGRLVADADSTLVIVARFLALLELFREAAIAFDQAEALGELDRPLDRHGRGRHRRRRRVRRATTRTTTTRATAPERRPQETTSRQRRATERR